MRRARSGPSALPLSPPASPVRVALSSIPRPRSLPTVVDRNYRELEFAGASAILDVSAMAGRGR